MVFDLGEGEDELQTHSDEWRDVEPDSDVEPTEKAVDGGVQFVATISVGVLLAHMLKAHAPCARALGGCA